MFLAISIFDLYLQRILTSYERYVLEEKDGQVLAITCYQLAWKFQGDSHPRLNDLKENLKIEIPSGNFIEEVARF